MSDAEENKAQFKSDINAGSEPVVKLLLAF